MQPLAQQTGTRCMQARGACLDSGSNISLGSPFHRFWTTPHVFVHPKGGNQTEEADPHLVTPRVLEELSVRTRGVVHLTR